MKCPYCSNEMEQGYIQNRDGVYWTPKKVWLSALAPLAMGAISIGSDDKLMPNSKAIAIAWHCDNCKMVIISYGNEAE